MIAIVNVSDVQNDFTGECDYEVRINMQVIGRFKHVRAEGLSRCLWRAMLAVRNLEQAAAQGAGKEDDRG